MAARRRPPGPSFAALAPTLVEVEGHSLRMWSLLSAAARLGNDPVDDATKVSTARTLIAENAAAYLRLILQGFTRLNELLKAKAPLTSSQEAWLRRQLDGLGEKGGA